MTLTEAADMHLTDKGSIHDSRHRFTDFYEPYFVKYRNLNRPVDILEIGIFNGKSILMYKSYFNDNCNIIGFDIEDKSEYNDVNVRTFIVDQSKSDQLLNTLNELGNPKFDIIIDDGSHNPLHQLISLLTLHRYVRDNGIYIIEDLHTSLLVEDNSDNMLSYLLFQNKFEWISDIDHSDLVKSIKNITINSRSNPLCQYNGKSITSIISFY